MKKIKKLFAHKIFKIFMWAFLVLLGLYLALVIYRMFYFFNLDKTNTQVEKIHNEKITMDDVMGIDLPPDPGVEADKTIEGIDVNNNGIRDDVEIAIFNKYPDSPKTRGALLQYALASQMQINQPFMNTILATELAREEDRAITCLADTLVPRKNSESFREYSDWEKINSYEIFIKDIQLNTDNRKKERYLFNLQVRSYSDLRIEKCDIDYSKL